MIKKYSYGHLMILEISSDQQKRPAGLIKRETGVNPVRSRHCKGKSSDKVPLVECVRNRPGRCLRVRILSQETCLQLF